MALVHNGFPFISEMPDLDMDAKASKPQKWQEISERLLREHVPAINDEAVSRVWGN